MFNHHSTYSFKRNITKKSNKYFGSHKHYYKKKYIDFEDIYSTPTNNQYKIYDNKENTNIFMNQSNSSTKMTESVSNEKSIDKTLKECNEFKLDENELIIKKNKEDKDLNKISEKIALTNISDKLINDAYYIPKKVANIYNYLCYQLQYHKKMLTLDDPHDNYSSVSPFILNDSQFISNSFAVNQKAKVECINKKKENTTILCIKIKLKDNKEVMFKINRFDNIFDIVKIFCNTNQLDTSYVQPLVLYITKALNSIYGIYNIVLTDDETQILNQIKDC